MTQIMRNREDTEEDLYKALIFDNLGINQGMIMENIVAQMLKAAGHDLYFHEYQYLPEGAIKEQKYEIDFLAVKKKNLSDRGKIFDIHHINPLIIWGKISDENAGQIYCVYEGS